MKKNAEVQIGAGNANLETLNRMELERANYAEKLKSSDRLFNSTYSRKVEEGASEVELQELVRQFDEMRSGLARNHESAIQVIGMARLHE